MVHCEKHIRLKLKDFLSGREQFHIARTTLTRRSFTHIHTHDFAEIFWIEQGPGLHWINGQSVSIAAGTVVLMRPEDAHDFRCDGNQPLRLVNIAFAKSHLVKLRQYVGALKNRWPWSRSAMPRQFSASPEITSRLRYWSDAMPAHRNSALHLQTFLIDMLHASHEATGPRREDFMPSWLRQTVTQFSEPRHLSLGAVELIRLSGRCHEHVNRTIRRYYSMTTTDLANQLRMEYAGKALAMSDRSIQEIALSCGCENLSYFYQLFNRHHGMTPRHYRMRQRAVFQPQVDSQTD